MRKLFLINDKPIHSGYGGGKIIRQSQKKLFEKVGYEVWEIAPVIGKTDSIDFQKKIIYISQKKWIIKLSRILQKVNLIEDYLNLWIRKTLLHLEQFIKVKDIVFCMAGGELSTIKLGSILKKKIGCKFVINLHDPILFTSVEDEYIGSLASKIPQRSRDYIERKYFSNADIIIPSSETYSRALVKKYPQIKIEFCHFGYHKVKKVKKVKKRITDDSLQIVYGGSFSEIQKPEILIDAILKGNITKVKLYLIGDHHLYPRLDIYKKSEYKGTINFMDQMSLEQYEEFVFNKIDIGFLSLVGSLSELCIPSKLYDYINLELPVLAAIKGDAAQIIKDNKIGVVCKSEKDDIIKAINFFLESKNLEQAKKNIKKIKPNWSLKIKFQKALKLINQL